MLRFPRHPDPFDYAPGSVDRGIFAFLLRLADEVHEVLLVAFCILPRSCETFAKNFEKID